MFGETNGMKLPSRTVDEVIEEVINRLSDADREVSIEMASWNGAGGGSTYFTLQGPHCQSVADINANCPGNVAVNLYQKNGSCERRPLQSLEGAVQLVETFAAARRMLVEQPLVDLIEKGSLGYFPDFGHGEDAVDEQITELALEWCGTPLGERGGRTPRIMEAGGHADLYTLGDQGVGPELRYLWVRTTRGAELGLPSLLGDLYLNETDAVENLARVIRSNAVGFNLTVFLNSYEDWAKGWKEYEAKRVEAQKIEVESVEPLPRISEPSAPQPHPATAKMLQVVVRAHRDASAVLEHRLESMEVREGTLAAQLEESQATCVQQRVEMAEHIDRARREGRDEMDMETRDIKKRMEAAAKQEATAKEIVVDYAPMHTHVECLADLPETAPAGTAVGVGDPEGGCFAYYHWNGAHWARGAYAGDGWPKNYASSIQPNPDGYDRGDSYVGSPDNWSTEFFAEKKGGAPDPTIHMLKTAAPQALKHAAGAGVLRATRLALLRLMGPQWADFADHEVSGRLFDLFVAAVVHRVCLEKGWVRVADAAEYGFVGAGVAVGLRVTDGMVSALLDDPVALKELEELGAEVGVEVEESPALKALADLRREMELARVRVYAKERVR